MFQNHLNGLARLESDLWEAAFAPFQRLHGKNAFEGAGMGLAICKRIVERQRGNITARSASGKGTTFLISLPSSCSACVS